MSISRRSFLGGAASSLFVGGCASQGVPRIIGANSKVNVAIIGCGLIARLTNVPGFLKDPRCRVTVACDMVKVAPDYFYGGRKSDFGAEGFAKKGVDGYPKGVCGSTVIKDFVDRHYGDTSCREVFDWREVVADPSVDAVCICTPDHWHAIIAIAAMKAGKHVFCQKPMSLGIREGQAMVRVAKATGVTFQVGNQGRSEAASRFMEEIALNGYAGKVLGATVCIPGGDHWVGHGHSEARAPLPKYMSEEVWNLWQGPARHWENNAYIPSIHEPTCWRFNRRYGGGMIPDFGAHEFDKLQRGLGTDLTGPVAVENMKTNLRRDNEVFTWAGMYDFEFVYASGLRVRVRPIDVNGGFPRQTTFHCEKGDVGIKGGKLVVPECLAKMKESDLTASDKRLYAPAKGRWHEADFVDGILERRQCCSPCEVGHRTITMAHIANVCEQLRVDRLGWDPVAERFTGPNAAAAEEMCKVEYCNGWELGA